MLTAGGVAGISAALALAGCSNSGSGGSSASGSGDSIEVFFNMTSGSPVVEVTKEIITAFQTKTGVSVNATYDQAGYEDAIKVRLASGDIPDVFATHGWSVMRYSEFLEPLNDRPWAQSVNEGLNSSMLDSSGNLYAVPLQYTVAGIGVNLDLLESAGVDSTNIKTWDDFNAAAAKIAATGNAVIASSGKDGLAGNVVNFICSGAFTDAELSAFKAGTFESDAYKKVLDLIASWAENGWFNKDYASASTDDVSRAMAEGTAAFMLDQPDQLNTALSYKADANIGFIPYPD
ncbi:ABC transporter substrate-binding protein, partial [Actinomyces radicidentis]|uniref:ABC transporter substrate-binding protein n=1 Tax=Actinomyces radicidentis TaxID=111015 RepID=UPI0026DF531A